jgi:hypothetical protein
LSFRASTPCDIEDRPKHVARALMRASASVFVSYLCL